MLGEYQCLKCCYLTKYQINIMATLFGKYFYIVLCRCKCQAIACFCVGTLEFLYLSQG